jgi:serine/threonine protein kinase
MPPSPRNAVALVVGIGAYPDGSGVPRLNYARRDAEALARLLSDPDACDFHPEKVKELLDEDATRDALVRALSQWLPREARGVELALIYFAGHGAMHRSGEDEEGYLLCHDARLDDLVTRGVSMGDVAKWIRGIDARAVVVCLDCCHAGAVLPGGSLRAARELHLPPEVLQRLAGDGRFLLASCRAKESSIESKAREHGLFTYHLLEGLRGKADLDRDGKVKVSELFDYVSEEVKSEARTQFGLEQTPWVSANYTHNVVLSTVRPAKVEAAGAPLTDEERVRIEQLNELRSRRDAARISLLFGSLAHDKEPVRDAASRALKAVGWEWAGETAERLARSGDVAGVGAVLDGLRALEAQREVVVLLDRLAGLLRGDSRVQAFWLLDRKRLALDCERLAALLTQNSSDYAIDRALGPGLYTGAYLAHHRRSELPVVLRILRREYVSNPIVRSAFVEQGKRAVRFVHRNLATTREVNFYEGGELYFTVRDHVDGPTLRDVLGSGRRFEPLAVVKLLRGLLDVLVGLHEEGEAHGGIKPSNVFLLRKDRVVLGDRSLPLPPPSVTSEPGRLAYDYRYVSPELFDAAGNATLASDVYAVGCVAHELFEGRPPHVADSVFELYRLAHGPVSLTAGSRIDDWLAGLLAASPDDRCEATAALAGLDALEAHFRSGGADRPRPDDADRPGPPDRRPPKTVGVRILGDRSLARFVGRESIVPAVLQTGASAQGGNSLDRFDTPQPSAEAEGELVRLGGYRILRMLGKGGMGVVYEAEDDALGRRVAVKVMKSEIAASPHARQRFLREARAAASIDSEYVCPIYVVGEANGVPFIAMPLLRGETLASRLAREKPLPVAEATRIGREAALGLAAAHDAGLVHRDVKPGNVWLEERPGSPPRVRLLDFGLARGGADNRLTISGEVMGTPAYLSPEQARGQHVDARSDLFSLGVLLYEMTTGKRPFAGDDVIASLTSLALDTPEPPASLSPEVPAALSDLILRLLEKSPEDRPTSAADVALALAADDASIELPPPEAPAATPQRSGIVKKAVLACWVLLTLALAAALAALVLSR